MIAMLQANPTLMISTYITYYLFILLLKCI